MYCSCRTFSLHLINLMMTTIIMFTQQNYERRPNHQQHRKSTGLFNMKNMHLVTKIQYAVRNHYSINDIIISLKKIKLVRNAKEKQLFKVLFHLLRENNIYLTSGHSSIMSTFFVSSASMVSNSRFASSIFT